MNVRILRWASAIIFFNTTWIQAAPVEYLVRFREPQDNLDSAQKTTDGLGIHWNSYSRIVNQEHGIVKLHFDTENEAQMARDRLSKSDHVVNLAPNFLYHPNISYHLQAQDEAEDPSLSSSMPLVLPYVPPHRGDRAPPMSAIPGVQVPPWDSATGMDPLASRDWSLRGSGLTSTLLREEASSEITVAVIDTGVDYNHEDLIAGMWRNPDNPIQVGFDFAHYDPRPYDQVHFDMRGCLKDIACQQGLNPSQFLVNPGHGTHCAGHVAAVANNALGIRGTGAGARIMALKFFYDYGEEKGGQGDDAAAIQSIDFAIKHGARIISASWGSRNKRRLAEQSELKQALLRARHAGVLVIAAAGNEAIDQDLVAEPTYPAAYQLDNMITVAAVDRNGSLAPFSNYGARSVDLAAPGVKILSTTVGNRYSDTLARFKDKNGIKHTMTWDGTSMATPLVAGAAALVWSKYPHASYREIKDRLLQNVKRVPSLQGKVQSGGILDVAAALR